MLSNNLPVPTSLPHIMYKYKNLTSPCIWPKGAVRKSSASLFQSPVRSGWATLLCVLSTAARGGGHYHHADPITPLNGCFCRAHPIRKRLRRMLPYYFTHSSFRRAQKLGNSPADTDRPVRRHATEWISVTSRSQSR